jgi:thiol-disulfide isomerase/thioredoxin
MRVLAAILFTLSLGVVGCTTPGKKPFSQTSQPRQPRNDTNDRGNSDQPWWREANQNSDTGRPPRVPQPEKLASSDRETIVAGEVVDERDQRRLNGTTFITVRVADQDVPTRRNPGVETDDQGFFYMPGLVPGQTYILTAVREVDGQKMAAEAIVKPPASNVRLVLSQNKVSSLTPTPPPPPGLGPFTPPDSKDRGWEPGSNPPTGGLPPVPVNRNVPVRPENIASTDPDPRRPPTVNIPTPAPAPQPPRQDPPQSRGPGSKVPNFIVSDVVGSDWEFRYASGRLVLLDFWSTSCGPCLRAVPSLKRLQADYGSSGLELIGLACEPDAPFASRAREVELVSRKKEMNYRVYLEREGHVGDVQRLFNVGYYPTLVLLDRSGTILWRGGATDTDLARLEAIVKQNLTKR